MMKKTTDTHQEMIKKILNVFKKNFDCHQQKKIYDTNKNLIKIVWDNSLNYHYTVNINENLFNDLYSLKEKYAYHGEKAIDKAIEQYIVVFADFKYN